MPDPTLTRREFVGRGTALAAGVAAAAAADSTQAAPAPRSKSGNATPERRRAMKIGFHTDAFNSTYFSFEKCLGWAQENQVHYIECGLIDGVS